MPQHRRSSSFRPRKRIIVACDGTWLNSDSGVEQSSFISLDSRPKPQIPSNVTRICRALKAESTDGIPQVIYYQAGVGSGPGIRDRFIGGSTGLGLSEHIREAYDFLANNYLIGDEIFLLGFSRGAFTARSISGLIGNIGILTKPGMDDFYAIFLDYQNSGYPDYRSPFPATPFSDKPNIRDPEYGRELERRGLTTLDVPIKAVGVWETVGSLGIPRVGWLDKLGPSLPEEEFAFSDCIVDSSVQNAFQALALDERREPFAPAVWHKPRGSSTYLKQVWFPGVHSNVGGGYSDQELANITLAWMMSQLEPFLDFNSTYLNRQINLNRQYYVKERERVRPWSFGEIYDSMTGIYTLAGGRTRTPGWYSISRRHSENLRFQTNEYIHASVRARIGLRGPGVEDKGDYQPHALKGWQNAVTRREVDGEMEREILWESETSREAPVGKVLPEDTLGETELELLDMSPEVRDKILGIGKHRHH